MFPDLSIQIDTWPSFEKTLEESFIQRFDSDSTSAKLQALRSIRNFVVASSKNTSFVLNNDPIRSRIISSTDYFLPAAEGQMELKNELLGIYSNLLRNSCAFRECLLSQTIFILNVLHTACDNDSEALSLRQTCALFLKTLFSADNLEQDLRSSPKSRKAAAMVVFTRANISIMLKTIDWLESHLRDTAPTVSSISMRTTSKLMLISLTKLVALLSTESRLAILLVQQNALRFAHTSIMAVFCPHHAQRGCPIVKKSHICRTCPDNYDRIISRFCLKLVFFVLYHNPASISEFKRIVDVQEPSLLISVYAHLSEPLSPCFLIENSSALLNRTGSRLLHGNILSDPIIHRNFFKNIFEEIELRESAQFSDRGKFISRTPDHVSCLLVGLIRGLAFLCSTNSLFTQENDSPSKISQNHCQRSRLFSRRQPAKIIRLHESPGSKNNLVSRRKADIRGTKRHSFSFEDEGSGYRNRSTVCSITAVDRFGSKISISHPFEITDEEILLKIFKPLTQNGLLLNGTRLTSWACDVIIMILNQSTHLHCCMLYSCAFIVDVDEKVASLVKTLYSAKNYNTHADLLERLISFSRLFACLASNYEDLRVRIGELSITKTIMQLFIENPSLSLTENSLCLDLTRAICDLLHALSRSLYLQCTLFLNIPIAKWVLELCSHHLKRSSTLDSISTTMLVSASSVLVNLSVCPLPVFSEYREKSVEIFNALLDSNCGNGFEDYLLNLHLNGIWGISTAIQSSSNSAKMRILSSFETLKFFSLNREVVDFLQNSADDDMKINLHSKPFAEYTNSAVKLRLHFLHKSLLFIRNLLSDSEVAKFFYSKFADDILKLISSLFASFIPDVIKEEALLIISNLMTNPEAMCHFWKQENLIMLLVQEVLETKSTPVKAAFLIIATHLLRSKTSLSMSPKLTESVLGQILSLLFENAFTRQHQNRTCGRRVPLRFRYSPITAASSSSILTQVENFPNPSSPISSTVIPVAQYTLENYDSEIEQNSVSLSHTDTIQTLPDDLVGSATTNDLFTFSRHLINREHRRSYRSRGRISSLESERTSNGNASLEGEPVGGNPIYINNCNNVSVIRPAERGETGPDDILSLSAPIDVEFSKLRSKSQTIFIGSDTNREMNERIAAPIFPFLRCLFTVLLEAHVNQQLCGIFDWQLIRSNGECRRHFLDTGHRLSIALKLLISESCKSLSDFHLRLRRKLYEDGDFHCDFVNNSVNLTLSANISPTATANTTETTHYSTSVASEIDFDEDL